MYIKRVLAVALCAALACSVAPVYAQSSKAPVEEVRELITLLELGKQMEAGIPILKNKMAEYFAKKLPDAKAVDLEEVKQITDRVFDRVPDEFVKRAVPLFRDNLTDEEVKILIEFAKSPVNKTIRSKLPMMNEQAGQIGALMAKELAREAFKNAREHLHQKGYKL